MDNIRKGDLLVYKDGKECFVTGIKEEWFATEIVRTIHLSNGSSFITYNTDRLPDWGIVKVVRNGST